MSLLSCCRYRVAIWVCLAIAEQHKPGPCNSRSNRQCNLLIHPSLVFVLKCLSFYPLRSDSTSLARFPFPWNSSRVLCHAPEALQPPLPGCVCVMYLFPRQEDVAWLRYSHMHIIITSESTFSCSFLHSGVSEEFILISFLINEHLSTVTKTVLEPLANFWGSSWY